MRLADKTHVTEDEEFNPAAKIATLVEYMLERQLQLDTYNNEYVIRITVDKVDHVPETNGGDDD